ncbi:MAG: hypothetical protein IPO08_23790 [Xanthomonadales bacterium]|nr:hypothetical protein [Xanthomonadales bacterium]
MGQLNLKAQMVEPLMLNKIRISGQSDDGRQREHHEFSEQTVQLAGYTFETLLAMSSFELGVALPIIKDAIAQRRTAERAAEKAQAEAEQALERMGGGQQGSIKISIGAGGSFNHVGTMAARDSITVTHVTNTVTTEVEDVSTVVNQSKPAQDEGLSASEQDYLRGLGDKLRKDRSGNGGWPSY